MDGGSEPGRARRGFALPVVLVLAMVLGGVLWGLDRVVSGFRNRSTRFRDGEVAYYAARSGLQLGETMLERVAGRPPPPGAPGRALYDLLVRSRPEDLDGGEDSVEIPFAERLIPGEGVDGEVRVTARFLTVAPLMRTQPPGIQADPLEKRGVLELESWARVGSAERRFVSRRDFHTLYRLPPVTGRFSLLFGQLEGTAEAANALTYSPRLGLFQRSVSRQLGWPLVVYPYPLDEDPARSPADRFEADPLAPMRQGGWVGLLGRTPWLLNLSFGPGDRSPLEEGYLLRNSEAIYPSPRLPGFYEKSLRLGYARDVTQLPMFAAYEAETIPDGTSLLHLAGDATHRLPPVVLGRAFRRYLSFSKLADRADGAFTSFHGVPEADFSGPRASFQGVVPGGDYQSYRQVMARSVVEPYNRSYDFVVTDRETRDAAGRVLPGDTPWEPRRHLTAEAVAPYVQSAGGLPGELLYPDPARRDEARIGGAVRLGDEAGVALFEGSLEDLLPSLRESLMARAVTELRDAPEEAAADGFARRYLKSPEGGGPRELELPPVLRVQAPRLELGPLHVRRGGTLLVDGDLVVTGPLTTARGEVLALVSLNGDVIVRDESPVAASLLALQGQVLASERGLDVRGNLVAARFDPMTWLGGQGLRRVVYDPRLDPARAETRSSQYRIHLGAERRTVVRRR